MMRAECQRQRELLDSFISSELLVETTHEILRHLEACPDCRDELDRRQRLRTTIKRSLWVDTPSALRRRVVAALQNDCSCPEIPTAPPGPAEKQPRWALLRRWRSARQRKSGPSTRILAGATALRQGVAVTGVGAILATVLLVLDWRTQPLSAAGLLQRSTESEREAAVPGLVLHRVITLEERQGDAGALLRRQRIELWQRGDRPLTVRRTFDESNRLVAGEWTVRGERTTVFRRGARPRVIEAGGRPAADLAGLIQAEEIWRMDLSAAEFVRLLPDPGSATVREHPDSYVIEYVNGDRPGLPVTRATLTLSRSDLRPVRQELVLSSRDGPREYRFSETGYRRVGAGGVSKSVFEPEPELSGPSAPAPELATPVRPPPSPPSPPPVPALAPVPLHKEIAALHLLHRIQACTLDEAVVKRTKDGGLQVEATIDDEARRGVLVAAVDGLALDDRVRLLLQSRERLTRAEPADGAEFPVRRRLREYFMTHVISRLPASARADSEMIERAVEGAVGRLAERAKYRAERAAVHVRALANLVSRFEEFTADGPLDLDDAAMWQTLVRDHARAGHHETEALRLELQAIFFPAGAFETGAGGGPVRQDAELPALVSKLLEMTVAHRDAVRAAFSSSPGAALSLSIEDPAFWRSLMATERLLGDFDRPLPLR